MDGLIVVLYLAIGVAAVLEARRKGFSELLFLLAALVFGPISFIVLLLLPMRTLAPGEVVKMARSVELQDGREIPRGHVTVVREARSRRGNVVCQVSAPDASLHWVAQEVLYRTGAVGS